MKEDVEVEVGAPVDIDVAIGVDAHALMLEMLLKSILFKCIREFSWP